MKLPIYVISLARDSQRRNHIEKQFSKWNIDFVFFDAVDAKNPTNKEILAKLKKSGMGNEMTDGEAACTLSHQLIYKDMLLKGHEWCLILEDDVIIDERLKTFVDAYSIQEQNKLKKSNLYLLGGQVGLHAYPVLGLSRKNKHHVSTCAFRRVNYNVGKIRRACSYLMSDSMAQDLLSLTNTYGTYRADAWVFVQEQKIIDDFYLDEIISHPIVNEANSHLESERRLLSTQKKPRSKIQLKMKILRSWIRVSLYSLLK